MMNQTAEDIAIEKGKLLNSQMFRPIQISDVTSQRLAFYLKKKNQISGNVNIIQMLKTVRRTSRQGD